MLILVGSPSPPVYGSAVDLAHCDHRSRLGVHMSERAGAAAPGLSRPADGVGVSGRRGKASPEAPRERANHSTLSSFRAFWRWLTSMRTALILLLVLASRPYPLRLAAAQRQHRERQQVLREHPSLGPSAGPALAFDVYASPWFSAVYLLLFVSLLGAWCPDCASTRTTSSPSRRRHRPNWSGLPHSAQRHSPVEPVPTAAAVASAWRRNAVAHRGPRAARRHGHRLGGEGLRQRRPAICCSTSPCWPSWSGWPGVLVRAGTPIGSVVAGDGVLRTLQQLRRVRPRAQAKAG
jgi:cytochrome c biogenesis protein